MMILAEIVVNNSNRNAASNTTLILVPQDYYNGKLWVKYRLSDVGMPYHHFLL